MSQADINKIHQEIDKIDEQIVGDLAKRFKLVNKLAPLKNGSEIRCTAREKEVLDNVQYKADILGVDKKLINILYKLIFAISRKQQRDILKNK